ncbi:hypothetical protein SEUCBS140593_003568 [Sporothrix eucalyptigena]|uniref:Zn(2)-C6 fungal-type domain-containing protein n=1 Tax=Sporothrix eucalyptigena TaxID=1812306 RepID=A0ABP0BG64_9PEZI
MPMPTPLSPAASALALREFFGDRKPPEISRKITACVACRKLKIKCNMPDSKPPCTRCKRRDLSCTVNHSLQMLLENDVTHHPADLISRGAIPPASAAQYFETYKTHFDHYVYNIVADHGSLSSIRSGSALLLAAVCTVGALHTQGADHNEYTVCYNEFMKEYTTQVASRHHTLDDVRGLCIAAFWLSDLSWMLSGAAVRIAVELNLHRGVSKAKHTCIIKTAADRQSCYLRTRLYLLVYICDHQFSIAYGRSPMTREFTALIAPRAFLELDHETSPDLHDSDERLVSQVELWSILSRVYDTFGINTELPVLTHLVPELRRFSLALESWRMESSERLATTSKNRQQDVGIDVGMHFHFAKLYLCAHAFRGVSSISAEMVTVPPETEEFADAAVYSAHSVLRSLVSSREMQAHLARLPTYFATMVAASGVFLLKMTIRRPANIRIDKADTSSLLDQVAQVLTSMTAGMHPQHVLSHIAASITNLISRVQQPAPQTLNDNTPTSAADVILVNNGSTDISPSSSVIANDDLTWLQDGDFAIDWFEFDQVLHNT